MSFRMTGDDLSSWLRSFLPGFDRESSQSSGSIKGEWVESRSCIETPPSIFIMVRIAFSTLLVAFVGAVAAVGPAPNQIKNLVTFGDSYTDIVSEQCENDQSIEMLTHMHNVNVLVPQDGHDDGGTVWPVFAASYGNFTLFPFAKVGATCSNALTPRPFPSLFESQLPAYFAAQANGSLGALKPHDTVYTLWIGTNDVGANALLTGGQTPGVTLVDAVSCAVDWVRALYDGGARNFIFQNVSIVSVAQSKARWGMLRR